MEKLGKFNLKLNAIPNGLEKYMSFTINNKLSFIDSFQFLSSSLDILVKNLSKNDFKNSSEEFDNNVLDLVKHEHILNVWKTFEMKTMKDYYDLCLKCNALLLPDVFEKFRNNSLKNYGLSASNYLSAPCLSWDVMLKMTKVEYKLIRDPDMYLLLEKGTIGGISYISNRYRKDNNKYLTLLRLGFLKVVFPGGRGGQFDPPPPSLIFQEELI